MLRASVARERVTALISDGGGENKEQIREEMWGEEEKKTWTRLRRERGIR
jgi:hypothetical protein